MSSTYTDLIEERREVSEQLQQMRCIPAGMELFTASGLPPWHLIQSAIDDSDYLVLILAGRYGSTSQADKRSYTEREYDYALGQGIPIIPFLHHDLGALPSRNVDADPVVVGKRDRFWARVRDSERHTVAFWRDGKDLAQQVMTAVNAAVVSQPRPGWVRGARSEAQAAASLAPDQPRQADTSTADGIRETLLNRGGPARVESLIDKTVVQIRNLSFLSGTGDYESGPVDEVHAQRLSVLETAALPLVRAVSATARWDDRLDIYLNDLIREFGVAPRANGYTALIDLVRAPAVLALTAAGVGSSAGRRDDMVGSLLSERLEVENLYTGEDVAAAAVLGPSLIYHNDWSSRRLRLYLQAALGQDHDAWQERVFDRAWARWDYLAAVAREFYSVKLKTSSGGMPYLRIDQRGGSTARPSVGREIRRDVLAQGDNHPLLSTGFCEGSAELFDEAAEAFESRYGTWGENQDWAALTPYGSIQSGVLPSGPHFPGEGSGRPA